jgi:hypothetical protein
MEVANVAAAKEVAVELASHLKPPLVCEQWNLTRGEQPGDIGKDEFLGQYADKFVDGTVKFWAVADLINGVGMSAGGRGLIFAQIMAQKKSIREHGWLHTVRLQIVVAKDGKRAYVLDENHRVEACRQIEAEDGAAALLALIGTNGLPVVVHRGLPASVCGMLSLTVNEAQKSAAGATHANKLLFMLSMWLLLVKAAKNDKFALVMRCTTVGESSAQVDSGLVKGVISFTTAFGQHGVELLVGTLWMAESGFSPTARTACQELAVKYKFSKSHWGLEVGPPQLKKPIAKKKRKDKDAEVGDTEHVENEEKWLPAWKTLLKNLGGLKGLDTDQRERADTCCSKVLFMFVYYMVQGEQLPTAQRAVPQYWKRLFEDELIETLKRL